VFPAIATDARVVARLAPNGDQAAVLTRDMPTGWLWGWGPDDFPRLSLRPLNAKHCNVVRIWLEDPEGKQCMIVEGKIPHSVVSDVEAIIAEERPRIEDAWVSHMIRKDWLSVTFVPGGDLEVVCYEGTTMERQAIHGIPWGGIVGDRLPESDDLEIDRDSSELVLRAIGQSRVRVPLRFLVFRGP
jgi:hypothetical protein